MKESYIILGHCLLSPPFPLGSCHGVQRRTAEILIPPLPSHVFPFPLWGVQDQSFSHCWHPASPQASLALPFALCSLYGCSTNTAFSNFSPQAPVFATDFSHWLLPTLICE